MARLIITGASGYIGGHLVSFASRAGHEVIVLGRGEPAQQSVPWRLGEQLDPAKLEGVDAVIHLAHAWSADALGQDAQNPNIVGTEALAKHALATGVRRFVFASTTSARDTALNAYGRNKFFLEQRLGDDGRVVIARIGLVYGGAAQGLYGLLRRIVGLAPILPMIGLDREVQPIHVDELSDGLLRMALAPRLMKPRYILAGPAPVRFADWLRWLRKAERGKGLLLINVPIPLVLLACDLTRMIPFIPTVDRERVLGLAGAAPMESTDSLAELQLTIADPRERLAMELPPPETRLAEAAALLRYLSRSLPSEQDKRDLVVAMEREGLSPLFLPALVLRFPNLMAFIEPPASMQGNRLARALHLADQLIEANSSMPHPPGSWWRTAIAVAFDLATLPLRLLTSRQFK